MKICLVGAIRPITEIVQHTFTQYYILPAKRMQLDIIKF